MTRENGYYWIQLTDFKGDWLIGEWDGRFWSVSPYPGKNHLYGPNEVKAIHAERIKEPGYQP